MANVSAADALGMKLLNGAIFLMKKDLTL